MIKLENVTKIYGDKDNETIALDDVSLTIKEGEMVAIMGPSGSGKSTLLYSVSGMDNATAGNIYFNNKDITKLSQKELADVRLNDMGFIFQQMYMLKNLTVLDNIILPGLQANKLAKADVTNRGKELMRKLSIIDIADNDINEVSGGQLQRACICRSLINNPKMIFADEPTGALNRTTSDDVMQELTKLNNEGTTILLVTHDVKVAAKCQRVLYIVDGNISGEYNLGKYNEDLELKERERTLNNWLLQMGW